MITSYRYSCSLSFELTSIVPIHAAGARRRLRSAILRRVLQIPDRDLVFCITAMQLPFQQAPKKGGLQ